MDVVPSCKRWNARVSRLRAKATTAVFLPRRRATRPHHRWSGAAAAPLTVRAACAAWTQTARLYPPLFRDPAVRHPLPTGPHTGRQPGIGHQRLRRREPGDGTRPPPGSVRTPARPQASSPRSGQPDGVDCRPPAGVRAKVHVVHPLKVELIAESKKKTDWIDAQLLAHLVGSGGCRSRCTCPVTGAASGGIARSRPARPAPCSVPRPLPTPSASSPRPPASPDGPARPRCTRALTLETSGPPSCMPTSWW